MSRIPPTRSVKVDLLIYGATPSGIMSAYSVKKAGLSVLIVEPGRWVGGILGAGLKPTQNMPNYAAVGGKTRELMLTLGVQSEKENLSVNDIRKMNRQDISPKYVREDFLRLLKEMEIEVIYNHRISRLVKQGTALSDAYFDRAPFDNTGCKAITPRRHECTNLLVPILFSSTLLGYSSARMEPTFMIIGESAGIAAAQAIRENVPVQGIDITRYLEKLKDAGQFLEKPGK